MLGTDKKEEKKKEKNRRFEEYHSQLEQAANNPHLERHQNPEIEKTIHRGEREEHERTARGKEAGTREHEYLRAKHGHGLTDKQRAQLQHEANQRIHNQYNAANRKLQGIQGQKGVHGRSGVAFAQQQELQREANNLIGQAGRDINTLSYEQGNRNMSAEAAQRAGGAAEHLTSYEKARHEYEQERERRKRDLQERQAARELTRI
jgi:hypothetical protein